MIAIVTSLCGLFGGAIGTWGFVNHSPLSVTVGSIFFATSLITGSVDIARAQIIKNQNALSAQNNPRTTTQSVSGN